MAIFAIRSARDANDDTQDTPNSTSNKTMPHSPTTSPRPAGTRLDETIQFDDDMAHFVNHLDADPLAEGHLKMRLVEYDRCSGSVRQIPDDEDDYTFLSFQKLSYAAVAALLPNSLPPSRTPSPANQYSDRDGVLRSSRKHARQRDFAVSVLQDDDSDVEFDWNASKARRGQSRARGLAKKRGSKVASK